MRASSPQTPRWDLPGGEALARQAGTAATPDTRDTRPTVGPAPPPMTFVAVPEIQEMLSLMKDLQARVVSL